MDTEIGRSYIDDALEVVQAVGELLLEVVRFDGDGDARAVDGQVQFAKLVSGQVHGGLHVRLGRHLRDKSGGTRHARNLLCALEANDARDSRPLAVETEGLNVGRRRD